MLRLALTPRWISFLALVLVLASCFVALSAWQVDRAQHKNEVMTAQDVDEPQPLTDTMGAQVPMPGYLSDQRVTLSSTYIPGAQVLVTGGLHDGDDGFWVVTMFEVDGAQVDESATVHDDAKPVAIAVVRGWVPDAASAADAPAPQGTVDMTGRLGPVEGPLAASHLPDGQVASLSTSQLVNLFDVYTYSGVVFPESAAASGARGPMEPVVLEKQETGGFDWQSAIYAVEWVFFAGFAFYIWFQLLRDAHRKQQETESGATPEYVVVKHAGEKDLHAQGVSQ